MFGGFTFGGPPGNSTSPGSAAVTAANSAMGMLVGPQGNVTSISGDGGSSSGNTAGPPGLQGGHMSVISNNTPTNISQDGSLGDALGHFGLMPMAFQLAMFLTKGLFDGSAPPLSPYAPPPAPPSGGRGLLSQGYPGGSDAQYSGYTAHLAPGTGLATPAPVAPPPPTSLNTELPYEPIPTSLI